MINHNINKILFLLLVISLFIAISTAMAQQRTHTVFFESTDYELHVYRIFGKEPGKTMFLIGGIQGDEPGGYLSADLYADFSLAKGNLIVVPRANFQSIVLRKRQVNADMNRKFAGDDQKNYEDKIVKILKQLMSESDIVLNLHDGSGFYSDTWISDMRNPKRYGQCIIADTAKYTIPETGKIINLEEIAKSVVVEINKNIKNPDHQFSFNNHKTKSTDSSHKEQRKSATYYALYKHHIPAFGIETSKSLPLELKIRHHNIAVNAFMQKLDIIPETPGVYLDRPKLRYIIITINGSAPIVLKDQRSIYVNKGDKLFISHIETNYDRGISADVADFGTMNDVRKTIKITKPTRITVRKDYYPCGKIYVGINKKKGRVAISKGPALAPDMLFFKLKINGREKFYPNDGTARLIKGDILVIDDVFSGQSSNGAITVNFKGFVGDKVNNTGEDRGYKINTGKDLWKRYSINKKGKNFKIQVTIDNKPIGRLIVSIKKPSLKYIVLKLDQGNMNCLIPGATAKMNNGKTLKLVDINTNIHNNTGVKAYLTGKGASRRLITLNESLSMSTIKKAFKDCSDLKIEIKRQKMHLGSIALDLL